MKNLSPEEFNILSRFIMDQFGLYFPPERQIDLEREIKNISHSIGVPDLFALVNLINSKDLNHSQLELIVNSLTIGETYFLREKKVFEILEQNVIPSVIDIKKNKDKTLTIWSAGCSTGEEVYSIAMILESLSPLLNDWQIKIFGTDINTESLKKAELGIYHQWSFRTTPAYIKDKYFVEIKNHEYKISRQLKNKVSFQYLNLAADESFNRFKPESIDIIFCRNVLMYFSEEVKEKILKTFKKILNNNGWMILSSSELSYSLHKHFKSVNYTNAILFKKEIDYNPEIKIRYTPKVNQINPIINSINYKEPELDCVITKEETKNINPLVSILRPERDLILKAEELFDKGNFTEVIYMFDKELNAYENFFQSDELEKAYVLISKAYANLGKLDEAKKWCKEAISINKINYRTHYLLANILLEAGLKEEAAAAFRNALFIEPNFILAMFSLGNIFNKQGKINEARKQYEIATVILSSFSGEEIVPESDGLTVSYLTELIKSIINNFNNK